MSQDQDSEIEAGPGKTTIFSVRTTIGQEKSVLQNMFNRLRVLNPFPDLKALMIAEQLCGYVFVEAVHQRDVMIAISGLRHVKGKIVGSIQLENITHVISPRKVTEILEEGDTVEIVSGIFQGQKAMVIRMPKEGAKEDVTLRLLESDSAISIKIHGDFLKLVQKGEKRQEEYIIKEMEQGIASGTSAAASKAGSTSIDGSAPRIEPTISVEDHFTSADTGEIFSFDEDMGEEEIEEESGSERSEEKPKPKKKGKAESIEEEEEEEDEWAKFGF